MADAEDPIQEIKKAVKEEKLIIGAKEVMRMLRLGKAKKIFLAANPARRIENDIISHAQIFNCPVEKLEVPNDELGTICKRQFLISVVAVPK